MRFLNVKKEIVIPVITRLSKYVGHLLLIKKK